jgi:hypothetical protein
LDSVSRLLKSLKIRALITWRKDQAAFQPHVTSNDYNVFFFFSRHPFIAVHQKMNGVKRGPSVLRRAKPNQNGCQNYSFLWCISCSFKYEQLIIICPTPHSVEIR